MSSKSKIRGTRWESQLRDWLNAVGHAVVRPALHGSVDRGDLFGIADWTIQARDTARIDLAGAVDDAKAQAGNAGTRWHVALIKRRRKGVTEAYAVMKAGQWEQLVRELQGVEAPGR